MGRVIWGGEAEPFTGGARRNRAGPALKGSSRAARGAGEADQIDRGQREEGDVILYVDEVPVAASIDGMVRGLIQAD